MYKKLVNKDELLKDVEEHFSAKDMLTSWNKINIDLDNKRLTNFGIAMNKWLNLTDSKLDEINSFMVTSEYQFDLAMNIVWKSEVYKHLQANSSTYNLSEALNEWYYYGKRLYVMDLYDDDEAVDILTDFGNTTNRWEGILAIWNASRQCPSIKEYILLTKECSFYKAYYNLMSLYSTNEENYTRLIKCVVMLSNLYNDHKLLLEELHADDDVRIGDLGHRVFTFPLVYALNNEKTGNQLKNLIRLEKQENGIKEYILTKLEDLGALSYSENNINHLREEALKEVESLGGNSLLVEWINENFSL